MSKITIMVGISGSGKSTKAIQLQKESLVPTVIVNRDSLRNMLFGYTDQTISEYYSKPDLYIYENQITSFQDYLIERALVKGNNVIVDNTNLKGKYLNEFKSKFGNKYDLEICKVDCPLEIAIMRDSMRARSVGKDVIMRQYQNLNILNKSFDFEGFKTRKEKTSIFNDPSKKSCYIFDIDGTLALNTSGRSPFDYSLVDLDTLNKAVKKCLDGLYVFGADIIICSGREATSQCEDLTKKWLEDNDVYCDWIMMRQEGDKRADYIVKEEMWRKICEKYYIEAMFDDRNQVVNHARSLGFNVFQVNEGNF